MTKFYGSLVGAPVQTLQQTGPGVLVSNRFKDGRDQVLWRDYATTNGNVIGDQISLGLYPSTTWLDPRRCLMLWDALGAGVTLNIGDVTFPSALNLGLSVAAKGQGGLLGGGNGVVAGQFAQVLWQRLGYAADPARTIELLATFAGANPANGNFAWMFFGRRDD